MIKFYREIIGTPVLHFEGGSLVAVVKDVILHPDTGKLEALWVKPAKALFSYGVLQTQDIVEWKKNLYVKNEDVIGEAADIIKIAEILSQKRTIIGNHVRTEAGEEWGRVVDVDFDTEQYFLRHLYVEKSLLGILAYDKRILSYDLIVQVLPEAVIVKGKTEKREVIKEPLKEIKPVLD